MAADLSRLRTGEKVAGVAAFLLFIDLFLKWYGIQIAALEAFARGQGLSTNISAWKAYDLLDLVLVVVIVVALTWVVLTATQRAPALPVALSVIVTALGALAAVLILYRILNQPGDNRLYSVGFGAWLGFLFALGIAGGGFLGMREEGTSSDEAHGQTEGLLGGREPRQPVGTEGFGAPTAPPGGGSTPPPGGAPAGPGGGATAPPGTTPGPPPSPGRGDVSGEPGGTSRP
jgi:hypothetical protein